MSELDQLADDLGSAKVDLGTMRAVVAKGAFNIKRDWQTAWAGLRHAPYLAGSVTYNTGVWAAGVWAEIGPDKSRRQGALGNIVEFGTSKNAPTPGGEPALQAEEARFVQAITRLGRIL